MSLVVPAVLPSSRADLEEKLALLTRIPGVNRVQIDVVDGRFASPKSWPFSAKATKGTPYPELEAMVQKGEMLPHLDLFTYEIDLMCSDAESMAEKWLALGATRLTFHAESTTNLRQTLLSSQKRFGTGTGFTPDLLSFGVAINLSSDLSLIEPCISEIEYVQFMGIVRIGRQGQPFDRKVFDRLRRFHLLHPDTVMQVDGGVSMLNAKRLVSLGVTNLIVGSALLNAKDPATEFALFEGLESNYGV